jgi:hypothetical protein
MTSRWATWNISEQEKPHLSCAEALHRHQLAPAALPPHQPNPLARHPQAVGDEALQGGVGLPIHRRGPQPDQHRPVPFTNDSVTGAAGLDLKADKL